MKEFQADLMFLYHSSAICFVGDEAVSSVLQKEYHRQEKKARPTKRCVVCYKNNRRKETVFWCPECEAALCVEECFKAFHTKLNF